MFEGLYTADNVMYLVMILIVFIGILIKKIRSLKIMYMYLTTGEPDSFIQEMGFKIIYSKNVKYRRATILHKDFELEFLKEKDYQYTGIELNKLVNELWELKIRGRSTKVRERLTDISNETWRAELKAKKTKEDSLFSL